VAVAKAARGGERWEYASDAPTPDVLDVLREASASLAVAALTSLDPAETVVATIARVTQALGGTPWRTAGELLDRALCDPRLAEVTPGRALDAQAALLAGMTFARDVSVWVSPAGRKPELVASSSVATASATRTPAIRAIESGERMRSGLRRITLSIPVAMLGLPYGAIVIRGIDPLIIDSAEELAAHVVPRIAITLERQRLLERNEAREHLLVQAAERRLARIGYDLHDGPLQSIAGLARELELVAADVKPLVGAGAQHSVTQSFAGLIDNLSQLEATLRATARSFETTAVHREPLETLLRREAQSLTRTHNIEVDLTVDDGVDSLTDSQAIALYRATQEALSNVREHSDASRVVISVSRSRGATHLTISDNGRGFEPAERIAAAAHEGRLGIVGICERVKLLGGVFHITSSPGNGTTLKLALAHWAPIGV
jgi:signal transduction histidine kinase